MPGTSVQATATPAKPEPVERLTLYYELDSAALSEESRENLVRLSEKLRRHPKLSIQLEGHTCELGTEEYNLMLGNKRAEAALQYLARLGVSPEQMTTLSFGELKPAATGNAPERLARNRRTEVLPTGSHEFGNPP